MRRLVAGCAVSAVSAALISAYVTRAHSDRAWIRVLREEVEQ